MYSSQPLWLFLSSCQSQGGEFALTFLHGKVRKVSFLPFIMPGSQGGEFALTVTFPEHIS